MSAALGLALFFTVALIAITLYFLMGSVPLLVLQHDTPMDSRFVRGFFDTYYRAAIFTAGLAAASYALASRPVLAAGGAVLGLMALALRRLVIPTMDSLRVRLQANEPTAIAGFRRVHLLAIAANLAQLVVTVGALITVSIGMK